MPSGSTSTAASIGLVLLFVIAIGLFGTGYGLVVKLINDDTYEKVKNQVNTIFIIDFILIGVLMIASLILTNSSPEMFQPYILVISHVTLLVALLSLSYSVLKLTN
jgi:hypothetical protein